MELDLRFSDKEITAWGSLELMKRMLNHIEFGTAQGLWISGTQQQLRLRSGTTGAAAHALSLMTSRR